jgi:hypothetical protein
MAVLAANVHPFENRDKKPCLVAEAPPANPTGLILTIQQGAVSQPGLPEIG